MLKHWGQESGLFSILMSSQQETQLQLSMLYQPTVRVTQTTSSCLHRPHIGVPPGCPIHPNLKIYHGSGTTHLTGAQQTEKQNHLFFFLLNNVEGKCSVLCDLRLKHTCVMQQDKQSDKFTLKWVKRKILFWKRYVQKCERIFHCVVTSFMSSFAFFLISAELSPPGDHLLKMATGDTEQKHSESSQSCTCSILWQEVSLKVSLKFLRDRKLTDNEEYSGLHTDLLTVYQGSEESRYLFDHIDDLFPSEGTLRLHQPSSPLTSISSKNLRAKLVPLLQEIFHFLLFNIFTSQSGLDWTGLDWTGLDWTGLDWTGTVLDSRSTTKPGMLN
ncbi:hypothetical protein CCH79_00010121 [Gambusia affinis]|uniref:Uncharacterized protein n=1 Tax=Gambusia affinis TaxID=33528 RepID=A0A315VZI9_GAMAF|nr:hypothetical protein CCH79_00010121 [Gambusia affinis]